MAKRYLSLLLVFGLLFCFCTKGQKITTKSNEALELYKKAEEKIDNMLTVDALPDLERAVQLDPEFALAWSRLSGIYQALGDVIKAKEALKKAKVLAPKVSKYEQDRITVREAAIANDNEKVFELVKQMAKEYPGDRRAHYILGSQFYFRNQREEALASFNKALEIDANYAPVFNMLGYTYASLGRYEEAKDALKKYAELLPDHPNPRDSYGELLLLTGNYDEATKAFLMADSLKPGVYFVLRHLGQSCLQQGKYVEAMNYYKKALEAAVSDAEKGDAHFEMGVLALEMEDYMMAQREAEMCQKLDPERPCPHCTKMEIYLKKGMLKQAKAEVELLTEKIAKYSADLENDLFYLQIKARLVHAEGDFKKAIELYSKGLARAGTFEKTGFLYALAEVCMDDRNFEMAIEELENALKINPNSSKIRLLLGKIYEKKGDSAGARSEFEKVIKILSGADKGAKEIKEAKQHLARLK